MTARQAPRERVDQLSEEEAAEWLERMDWESVPTESLTAEELAAVLAADQDIAEGHFVDGEDLLRRLGL